MSALYTIPARIPFADALAAGLLHQAAGDPLALASMVLLLPTRRAQRTVRDAFLRQSAGRPLLLPRLLALGDLDEDEALFSGFRSLAGPGAESTGAGRAGAGSLESSDADALDIIPPAIPPLRRRLLLARLVMARGDDSGRPYTPDQAVQLADDLGRLLDQVQVEGLDFSQLATLAPERYAAHWQRIVDFLSILTIHWPRLLEAEGCLDPADRRNRLLQAQARAWQACPPDHPVIAAGITGSVPAAAQLLAVISRLPGGMVVLPDLDRQLDEESWQLIDDSHPHHALRRLLQLAGACREDVRPWPLHLDPATLASLAGEERQFLASEMMRPAQTTHRWRELPRLPARALDGVRRIDCPGQRDEALVISLLLRETLETAGKTAALVTPDRDLARRVAADLLRWGIRVDDSAGRPLTVTPPGAFLRLTAAMVTEGFAPVPLLAVLKHPLAGAGMDPALFRDAVRRLETRVLRGVRPAAGLAGIRATLAASVEAGERDYQELEALLLAVEDCCAPLARLMAGPSLSFAAAFEAHMQLAEQLSAIEGMPGPLRLWAEDAGDVAARWARELAGSAFLVPDIPPRAYAPLLDAMMAGEGVRQEFGSHPRLAILGPLEARLRHADLVVIGGLNEDVWPPRTVSDPWMSRPMRSDFGLPQPEQRIGHTAHDFASLFCAPSVVLTRPEKVDGTPKVPSRWLLRLETVLRATGLPSLVRPPAARQEENAASPAAGQDSRPWLAWAGQLDQPAAWIPPRRPAPCPPVEARPRKLSATRIETWMRDPYAIYARHILGLSALDPLDAEPGPADYGRLVHRALELFQQRHPDDLPADPLSSLLDCGRTAFADAIARPAVWAFWWPRFEKLSAWVVAREKERRQRIRETFTELRGEITIGEDFTLFAIADRVDVLRDGSIALVDYKTGSAPGDKEVLAGYAPQLPLEALIARHGGFAPAGARPVSELAYWELKGEAGGQEKVLKKETPEALAQQALEGLQGLISAFSRQETPYLARPHPEKAPTWSDYLHLARVREWSSGGGADD